ncbi:hypothetical protein [Flavobacterium sp.]|uniref:hypothetical protein n=1 Tax=Flavobacterium sp. TaxID=239 RepID=UPI00403341A5
MNKCKNCGRSVDEGPLKRVNEIGITGIFWSEPCIKEHEPELYKNIMDDKTDVEKDLEAMFYPSNNPIKLCSTCGVNLAMAHNDCSNCASCEDLKNAMK